MRSWVECAALALVVVGAGACQMELPTSQPASNGDRSTAGQPADSAATGSWVTGCYNRTILGREPVDQALSFTGGDGFTLVETEFGDGHCQHAASADTASGTFALETDNTGVETISFRLNRLDRVLLSQDAVNQANLTQVCGIGNWELGKVRDLLSSQCRSVLFQEGSRYVFDARSGGAGTLWVGSSSEWFRRPQ